MDNSISLEQRNMLNDVARSLDKFFNGEKQGSDRTTGFVLLTFPLNSTKENHDRFGTHPDIPGGGAMIALEAMFTVFAPCPACFESSGYVWEHGNDWDSGPWSHQTNITCPVCEGAGIVPCEVAGPPDYHFDFDDEGYLSALSAEEEA